MSDDADSTDDIDASDDTDSTAADATSGTTTPLPSRLGRLLFGLGLALQASEDFRDMEDSVEYAEDAGVPMPDVAAPFASGMMLVGGLGLAFWRLPRLATGAVVTFLAVVTPTMHDFWNEDGDASGERLAFFGNLAMLGAALAFLREAYRR